MWRSKNERWEKVTKDSEERKAVIERKNWSEKNNFWIFREKPVNRQINWRRLSRGERKKKQNLIPEKQLSDFI